MWREADQGLLERLEEEEVLSVLWRHHLAAAGLRDADSRARPPHPRAAGMLTILRTKYRADDALKSAASGDVRALRALVEPPSFERVDPALLHHLALYYGNLADTVESLPQDFATPARVRSLAAWLALAREGTYLTSLATRIAGGSLPNAEVIRAAVGIAGETIDSVGGTAMGTARERTPAARSALRTLARVKDACDLAGLGESEARPYVLRADALRASAVDEAIAAFDHALTEGIAQGRSIDKLRQVLTPLVDLWTFTEYDEAVERFYVERTPDICWEIYRKADWGTLRGFLAPFYPLVENLALSIEKDPSKVAYASHAAQFLIFRSESNPDGPEARRLCEWALRICPSHRNGRLLMAAYLCADATAILNRSKAPSASQVAEAMRLLERAEKTSPASGRVATLKKRLEALRPKKT